MSERFLPWQVATAREWLANRDRLAHAVVIHGLAGIGKRLFARALASALLCEAPEDTGACGQCTACQWIAAGNHPDLKLVRPQALAAREGSTVDDGEDSVEPAAEEGTSTKKKLSEELRVDEIRALEPWYHRATHRGGLRIVVLYPAEALNVVSANALLKSLEEPPANTLFLLVADAPDRLLPTILSRCQKLPLPEPAVSQSIEWLAAQGLADPSLWLAAAGSAPLRARELAQSQPSPYPDWAEALMTRLAARHDLDLPGLADELASQPASLWLGVLQQLCVDTSLAAAGLPIRYYPALQASTDRLAARAPLRHWVDIRQWLAQQTRLANHPLTPKLFAQTCLQRLCEDLK